MLRVFSGLFCCAFLTSTSLAANFWLSSVDCLSEAAGGCAGVTSSPPTAVPTITKPSGMPDHTLYIWAQPAAAVMGTKTLENWSLKLVSSNPNVVSFTSSSIYNPIMGVNGNGDDIVRWEFPDALSGPDMSLGLSGLNIFGVESEGIGIGSDSAAIDPFDNGANAWLLASVNYSVLGTEGQTAAISMQIGDIGINYAGESSSQALIYFGASGTGFNAETQRGAPSSTHVLTINVANTLPGDFDSDGDVDGRDFLAWQRNPSVGPLADWQANYGTSGLEAVTAIPEPSAGLLMFACGFVLSRAMTRGLLVPRIKP